MKEDYLITIHGTMEQDGESDSVKPVSYTHLNDPPTNGKVVMRTVSR